MKPKILIVDDEEDVREYLTRLLARRNFKTISASSGSWLNSFTMSSRIFFFSLN